MSPRFPFLAALTFALAAGCFDPKLAADLACGPGGACPPGQACAADGRCHAPGDRPIDAPGGDPADASRGDSADARPDAAPDAQADAMPDAAPFGCQGNDDCAVPPDLCSQAGTCDLATHVCSFPPVTCTQLDSDCAQGVCDLASGACVAMPRNEDASCGAGTVCDPFGPCGGFSDVCDESGTQSRTCMVNTCHAGACTGATMADTAACQRASTDGTSCGAMSVGGCGACGDFVDLCDETGTQTCTCTQPVCAGGTCGGHIDTTCAQDCFRDTNGKGCGNGNVCLGGDCQCPTC